MTTIAVRDGVVAFDGRSSTDGGTVVPDMTPKAIIIPRLRCIFAAAGGSANINMTFMRMSALKRLPWEYKAPHAFAANADSCALILTRKGLFVIDSDGWWPAQAEFFATGSGTDAALAAMHMGASAEQAVDVAIKVDRNSGPPINMLRVTDIP